MGSKGKKSHLYSYIYRSDINSQVHAPKALYPYRPIYYT